LLSYDCLIVILRRPQLATLDSDLLRKLVSRIVDATGPQKIVLFGSRAQATHRPDSDVDLLVIQESTEPRYRRAVPIYRALADLRLGVDKDIIVYTPEEVEEWSGASAAFVTTALREGKVIYEK
jgi:predicted nucleotidyltransferase